MRSCGMKNPAASLFESYDIEEYHKQKTVLSKSMLCDLLPPSCPAKFKFYHLDGGAKEETKALRVGTAVHLLALEPEKFAQAYHVLPEGFRRDARTEKYQHELAQATGRPMLSKKEHAQVLAMADAIRKNPIALKLLDAKGLVEASIFWEEPDEDENKPPQKFRCRPDFMRTDGLVIDLKTCRSAHPATFERDAYNYHYAMSAALTGRGYKAYYGKEMENYVFLAIESEPPYLISAFDSNRPFDDVSGLTYLEVGDKLLDTCVSLYKKCKETNNWPAYQENIKAMGVPYWAEKFIQEGEF